MENEDINSKIPLLKDVETDPIDEPSEESIYPVKLQKKKECRWKKCQRGKCKRGRCIKKCFKVICKAALALFLVLLLFSAVVGYQVYSWVSSQVQHWTVTVPTGLLIQEVPAAELAAVKDSAKFFFDSIENGKVPEDLVLSARDVNGFFAASDFFRGNAFAKMKDNEYSVSVSLPTDGLPGGKGRFFVATKTVAWDPNSNEIKVSIVPKESWSMGIMADFVLKLSTMEDGKTLHLEIASGEFFGKTVPQDVIDEHNNLLEGLYSCHHKDENCMRTRKALEGLAGISLEDGQVVFHAEVEPKEATYYAEHRGRNWHHGHHHHGKHGLRGTEGLPGNHRRLLAEVGGGHRWKALRTIRRLLS